jgi:hypothetical protein
MLAIGRAAAESAALRNSPTSRQMPRCNPFEHSSFDVAVSRMGCMFFADAAAAFANVRRACRVTR